MAINLKHAGFLWCETASAEEGELAIRAALPDLVILDWMLPGQSGWRWPRSCVAMNAPGSARHHAYGPGAPRGHKIQGLEAGATITSPSPFRPRNWWPGRGPFCAAAAWLAKASRSRGCSIPPPTACWRPTSRSSSGPNRIRLLFFFMTHPERVYTRAQSAP